MKEEVIKFGMSNDDIILQEKERRMNEAKNLLWSFHSGVYLDKKKKMNLDFPSGDWWGQNILDNEVYYYQEGFQYDVFRKRDEITKLDGSKYIQRHYVKFSRVYRLVFYPYKINYYDKFIPVGAKFVYGDHFQFLKPDWSDIIQAKEEKGYWDRNDDGSLGKYHIYTDYPSIKDSVEKDGQPLKYFIINNLRTKEILKLEPTFWFVDDADFDCWEYYMIEHRNDNYFKTKRSDQQILEFYRRELERAKENNNEEDIIKWENAIRQKENSK